MSENREHFITERIESVCIVVGVIAALLFLAFGTHSCNQRIVDNERQIAPIIAACRKSCEPGSVHKATPAICECK
jgi:hypothetical protein